MTTRGRGTGKATEKATEKATGGAGSAIPFGNSRPELRMAARTRSEFSCTVESGKPTVLKVGQHPPLWLSA